MQQTFNDLTEKTRQDVCNFLQKLLADGIDLTLVLKHVHWNIKGPSFIAVHELIDKVHEEVETHVDSIAERIAQLGGMAEGTRQALAKNSEMPEFPVSQMSEMDYIRNLCRCMSFVAKNVRLCISDAQELKDEVTADILIQTARNLDKNLWFIESHLSGGSKSGSESVKTVA